MLNKGSTVIFTMSSIYLYLYLYLYSLGFCELSNCGSGWASPWCFCLHLGLFPSYWVTLSSIGVRAFALYYDILLCHIWFFPLDVCSILKGDWAGVDLRSKKDYTWLVNTWKFQYHCHLNKKKSKLKWSAISLHLDLQTERK